LPLPPFHQPRRFALLTSRRGAPSSGDLPLLLLLLLTATSRASNIYFIIICIVVRSAVTSWI
jgi:hypothetical protein